MTDYKKLIEEVRGFVENTPQRTMQTRDHSLAALASLEAILDERKDIIDSYESQGPMGVWESLEEAQDMLSIAYGVAFHGQTCTPEERDQWRAIARPRAVLEGEGGGW